MLNFLQLIISTHDDVIKWKHFPRYWPFGRGIHRSPGNSPHKGQWRGALMFSLICTWINAWVNNREAGDLRRRCTHYDVTVMSAATRAWRAIHPFLATFRPGLRHPHSAERAVMGCFRHESDLCNNTFPHLPHSFGCKIWIRMCSIKSSPPQFNS